MVLILITSTGNIVKIWKQGKSDMPVQLPTPAISNQSSCIDKTDITSCQELKKPCDGLLQELRIELNQMPHLGQCRILMSYACIVNNNYSLGLIPHILECHFRLLIQCLSQVASSLFSQKHLLVSEPNICGYHCKLVNGISL